jgi:riboflavin kinase/FMN adenylyltransferase
MRVYKNIDDFKKIKNAVVTTGTFDGVHLGHIKILRRLNELAQLEKGESVVITFWPHPRLVLNHQEPFFLLSTLEERIDLMRKIPVDHLVVIDFTSSFSELTSVEFIQNILVDKIGTKKLVIGYDHRFGKNREGSFESLNQNASRYGFNVEEIPRQDVDQVGISSTEIRKALERGDISLANHYLGRGYSFRGEVVEGDRIGRTLGYPTANIYISETYKLIPPDGIYACWVYLPSYTKLKGMLYIGNRPTVSQELKHSIEVNILDFDEQIYGQPIEVEIIRKVRGDQVFPSLDDLKIQMQQDEKETRAILGTSIRC